VQGGHVRLADAATDRFVSPLCPFYSGAGCVFGLCAFPIRSFVLCVVCSSCVVAATNSLNALEELPARLKPLLSLLCVPLRRVEFVRLSPLTPARLEFAMACSTDYFSRSFNMRVFVMATVTTSIWIYAGKLSTIVGEHDCCFGCPCDRSSFLRCVLAVHTMICG
jgi:hypothetical protein